MTVRSILEKLIYKDNYEDIDKEMSESNVGARKRRNIRDHLFVMYSVMNDIKNGKGEEAHIHVYDIVKCFDKMWLKEVLNDLYDVNMKNDQLSLLYDLNKTSKVAIKTPCGITKRTEMNEIVTQGGVWGPLECSVQIDSLGKESLNEPDELYKYKGQVSIPPLAMIDDIAAISKCGIQSLIMNSKINAKIESKRLQLGIDKCQDLHIGKKKTSCPTLKVHEQNMSTAEETKYFGDWITIDGLN